MCFVNRWSCCSMLEKHQMLFCIPSAQILHLYGLQVVQACGRNLLKGSSVGHRLWGLVLHQAEVCCSSSGGREEGWVE